MKYKLILSIVAIACGVTFTGCKPAPLVEVKIETVWTPEQYNANRTWSTAHPHTIVTRLDTGERMWIRHHTWGTPGEVILISECKLNR